MKYSLERETQVESEIFINETASCAGTTTTSLQKYKLSTLFDESLEGVKIPQSGESAIKILIPNYSIQQLSILPQATSIPSELVFSTTGNVVDDDRTCLTFDDVSKPVFLACMKNHINICK